MNKADQERLKIFDFNYAKQKPVIKPKPKEDGSGK